MNAPGQVHEKLDIHGRKLVWHHRSHNFRLFAVFFTPKLSDLVEVWRSYKKNNFACVFIETL